MPLLVDGYNVLHAAMPPSLAGLDEGALCRLLGHSGWRWGRCVVVCDGGVKPGGPARSPVSGVDLVYTGPGRTADAWIIRAIESESSPRRLVVVSSDRQIQKAARRRRCRVMASVEMVRRLAAIRGQVAAGRRRTRRATDRSPTAAEGDLTGPLDERQVEHWLRWFDLGRQGPGGP